MPTNTIQRSPRTAPATRLWATARGALGDGMLSLRHTANALLLPFAYPRTPDDLLQALTVDWTLDKVVARVVRVQHETADTTSLYLAPTGNFRPHRAGQHVLLTVTLGGVQHTRCFSLSDAHRAGRPLRLTIKAHAAGRVSTWARDHARAGMRVSLSQAQGDFVLPDALPKRLLFVSGGSGMTPLLAMARSLVDRGYRGSLHWLHSDRADVALLDEMRACCAALGARLELHHSGAASGRATGPAPATRHRLSTRGIASRVPDFATRALFMCGPHGLMDTVAGLYEAAGHADQVHEESFGPRKQRGVVQLPATGAEPRLILARSRRTLPATRDKSLLLLAEEGGLHPPHGCRRGICHTCKCNKQYGTVRNELTGALSDARDEEIRLCIHTPITDVALDL